MKTNVYCCKFICICDIALPSVQQTLRYMKNKFCLIFLLVTVAFTKAMAQDTVYVSNASGNDVTGNGTIGSPYKTIFKGVDAALFASKKAVVIDSGTYTEVNSISISKPLIVKAKGNGPVIIDATNRGISPDKYMMGVTNTGNVVIDGLTFQNCRGLRVKGIYIIKTNGGVNAQNGNIEVRNCIIRNISWNATGDFTEIPPNGGDVANAIRVEGQSPFSLIDIRIDNNEVYNCVTGRGEAISIVGNVEQFRVSFNKVYQISNIGIVAAGNYDYTTAPFAVNQARNGFIVGNEVYRCMSPVKIAGAIYLDGALNCVVERNRVYESSVGISVGAEEVIIGSRMPSGNHKIYNNLLYNNCKCP
jgi:hypothetical protein